MMIRKFFLKLIQQSLTELPFSLTLKHTKFFFFLKFLHKHFSKFVEIMFTYTRFFSSFTRKRSNNFSRRLRAIFRL